MTTRESSVAAVIWLGALASVAVSLLFAPIIQGGWCSDAPVGGTSVCGSFQQSLVGIDTNPWIWLATIAGIAAITVLVASRRHRKVQ